MNYEFRMHEMDIGNSIFLCCHKCVSNYMVAARNECSCREENRAKSPAHYADFLARIDEVAA